MTTAHLLAFFIVVALIAYKGKGRHIYNIALHGTAFSLIYILIMFFGPAKYTVDISSPAIQSNGKLYLFAWSINRMLPFESMARPYMLVPKFDGSHENTFYPIPNKALKQQILDEVREKRRNPSHQANRGYNPYQGEGTFRQYLAIYLYLTWFVLYYSYFKRKKAAISHGSDTLNKDISKLNKKAKGEAPKEVNVKRLHPATITQEKSLKKIDEWINITEGLSFFRHFYKKSRLRLLHARKEQIIKEIVATFGVIAKSMEAKKHELYNSNIEFMKNQFGDDYDIDTPTPDSYQFLIQWVYQLMTQGIFDMSVNVQFQSSGSTDGLKMQQAQDLEGFGKDYQIVFSALEDDTERKGKTAIEKQLIKTIQSTLDVFLPEPIFKIKQDSKTVLDISFASDYKSPTSRPDFQYLFGTESDKKAHFYHFNRWKIKALLTSDHLRYETDYTPIHSKTADLVREQLKLPESGQYNINDKRLNGSLPTQLRTVVNMAIARSASQRLLISGNSQPKQANELVKNKSQVNREMDDLFDQIREEIRDSLLEEITSEPCEQLVEEILNSDHPIVDECITKVISVSGALGIAMDEEMIAELASTIASELAGMAATAMLEGATS
ncbi:hypothetical protein [Vibrio crassostreae]|uniref:hypothetical protein n=1 Tax=Vibrio crassostreae TaxID=246167 RepID=UPI0002D39BBB|nr:hypothetical protein [Vibrio crassostreae]OEE89412.1 hypothetical protein A140_18720 [Vibrio crassostreae 9ZC88]